jgi:iron(III) transport system substrate-binding protein
MLRLTAASLVTLALIAACGDDDDDATSATEGTDAGPVATSPGTTAADGGADSEATMATSATTGDGSGTTAAGAGGDAEAALAELVAAAEEEGSVTIYSGQGLDQLNALAAAFEEEYPGISVEVVRSADADIIPRVETELSTNTSGGDLVVIAAEPFMQAQADAGSWVDPTASPQLAGLDAYDAEQYVHEGNFFEVGAAVLTFAWNTDDVPDGLTDYPDLLDPELAGGRIAVIDPAISPAVVDYYLWLEENFGEEFIADLAAQEPRIYPSALPIGEALTSGEVSAAAYAAPVQLVPAAEGGAPVDFGISEVGAWGARYFGAIPKSSDSPNAAALLADFMVTPQGQELVQGASGSVLPEIPGTLITNDRVRKMDLEAIAPEPAAAYVEEWNALFR